MTQTTKYKLPQWEKPDRILMEDFNGMAAKLETALTAHDTALAAKADKTTTTNLQTQVNQKADVTLVEALQAQLEGKSSIRCGIYWGNSTAGRQIALGIDAQFAMIFCQSGGSDYYIEHAFISPVGALYRSAHAGSMSIHKDIILRNAALNFSTERPDYLNQSGRSYFYIAFQP